MWARIQTANGFTGYSLKKYSRAAGDRSHASSVEAMVNVGRALIARQSGLSGASDRLSTLVHVLSEPEAAIRLQCGPRPTVLRTRGDPASACSSVVLVSHLLNLAYVCRILQCIRPICNLGPLKSRVPQVTTCVCLLSLQAGPRSWNQHVAELLRRPNLSPFN